MKNNKNNPYDVVIIGGGPAGLTAAIYTSREKLTTLVLEKAVCGGLPATVDLIENYPGFPQGIKGLELMERIKEQAVRFGANIAELEEAKKIELIDETIKVTTNKNSYQAQAVIIATGGISKKIKVPGEKEFFGKGVSYCATCDGPLFRNKDIVVVGASDSALQEALFLTKFARKVNIVHRKKEVKATQTILERVFENPKIEFLLHHELIAINGEDVVKSVIVRDLNSDEEKKLDVSGVFIYAGFLPNTEFVSDLVELDDAGYIITNEKMETSISGIFAAGDVRAKKIRQISVACGEGTIAAISVREFLRELRKKKKD